MAKKKQTPRAGADRKARVEELKRQQKAAERRKTFVFGGVGILIAATLIAIPVVSIVNKDKEKKRAFEELGVPTAAAACDTTQTDKVGADDGDHENDPSVRINYETAPPSHGRHFAAPATINSRGFYTKSDAPRLEELVHNLEHGYNVVWYDPDAVTGQQLEDLKTLAAKFRDDNETRKFIAVPWDAARGKFPAGKTIAMAHWGAPKEANDYATSTGYRQYCGQVSGGAIRAFVQAHPSSDSPEPNTM